METKRCIAFWASLLISSLWAASNTPHGTVIAGVWAAFAILVLVVDILHTLQEDKTRSNVELRGRRGR